MKTYLRLIAIFVAAGAVSLGICGPCFGDIAIGQSAPEFSLTDADGNQYESLLLRESLMNILYFFDIDSRASVDGLLFLDKLAKRYKDKELRVWAIAMATPGDVKIFQAQYNLTIPILADEHSMVSNLFNVKVIFPTSYIIGPQLKIFDIFQGGGKSAEVMLARLAERLLQRKELTFAKAISDTIIAENPDSVDAKVINAYAALHQDDLDSAKIKFSLLAKKDGAPGLLGMEGLTAVYAKAGQTDKALALAREVETLAPDRGYVNTIKGDLLYENGMAAAAEEEYRKAIQKTDTDPFLKAKAYNQLGRLQVEEGQIIMARSLYDKAVQLDPYYIEATTNKGLTYEKEGKLEEANRLYNAALNLATDVDRAIVTMKKANIAFNAPESMHLSDTDDIVLVLDMTRSMESLTRMIESRGKKQGAAVKVTNRMGAQLTGSNFNISPISKEVQVITAMTQTEWRWEISPRKPGEHSIHLSLNAYFDVQGHDTAKMIETFKKTIRINVTWVNLTKTFFQSNWKWLWTSLFIPIAVWLWKRRDTLLPKYRNGDLE